MTLSTGHLSSKIKVELDCDGKTCKTQITWVYGYHLEREDWCDEDSAQPEQVIDWG